MYQAQAIATTKLASNKAICLKTKKINKSKNPNIKVDI